jgi:hypothetical protein
LLIPVDVEVCLAEPFCGLGLPARIFNDRADNDNPMVLLAVDQHAAAGIGVLAGIVSTLVIGEMRFVSKKSSVSFFV